MNRACIQRTVFIDHPTGEKSFGYRMYDDHGQTYCNTLSEAIMQMSPQAFLDSAQPTFDDVATAIYDHALERGLYVDDSWYHFNLEGKNGPELIPPAQAG